MANFKAIFLYQDPWEAERFQVGVGRDKEVVGFPQGTDLATVGSAYRGEQPTTVPECPRRSTGVTELLRAL